MAKESGKGEEDPVGGSMRPHCLKPPWEATPYAMWKDLTDLFQSSSDHRKLALKDKLRKIKMEKNDTILVYLTKFVQCRDEMGSLGITLPNDGLVSLALFRLPKSWHIYEDSVNEQEKLSDWE